MIINICKLSEIEVAGKLVKVGVDTIEPKLPEYGKEGDACMDVYPIDLEYDVERDRWIYHTGLAFAVGNDTGYTTILEKQELPNEMELRPRSNLTKSDFYIPNAPGTLDWGYRGELLMIFKNRTSNDLVQALSTIITALDKLSMRAGCNGEIKQYTSAARRRLSPVLQSTKTAPYKCDGKDRCCQLIIRGAERIQWHEVKTVEELGITERGKGGFGSTQGCSNLK